MDKITYLAELAEGLARWVPERERQDILRWYAEYFEEAGIEREAEVVAELGDPWALSCRLAVEGGYVTQEKAAAWKPRKTWRRVLIGTAVGLSVFALVAGIGLMGMLAFNVTRAVSGSMPIPVFGEAEQVTVVDWGLSPAWGEYNVAFADNPSVIGPYLIDSESVEVFYSIDIDISLGNIQVVAGDDYTLSVRRGGALIGYEPVLEFRDGVLRLRDSDLSRLPEVSGWDDLKNLFGADQWAMDVTITVPGEAALDKLSIKTGLGDVWLYGGNAQTVAAETGMGEVMLYGVSAESVTAETGVGNVECYNPWNVRKLDLSTGLGDVELSMDEACGGLSIRLESGKGNVDATLCGYETDYSYALESGLGCVTVNGGYQNAKVLRRGNQPYQLNAESGMGDVNVYFTFG